MLTGKDRLNLKTFFQLSQPRLDSNLSRTASLLTCIRGGGLGVRRVRGFVRIQQTPLDPKELHWIIIPCCMPTSADGASSCIEVSELSTERLDSVVARIGENNVVVLYTATLLEFFS